MQNVMAIWNGLDMRRRLILVGAVVAVFVAILAINRVADTKTMVLLYAGLEGRAAGQVMTALDQRGAIYEVRGDSIWVASDARDTLRMSLAGEGLPPAGGAGYEILDTLSGFGTTAQMFDAAYWRAKEGELARTIMAVPDIRAARVHISQGPADAFRRQATPTASVTVTTASGQLSEEQARGLQHLVASAVMGMRPVDVEVIDTTAGLVSPGEEGAMGAKGAQDRATEIRRSVERLLAARVGAENAVVEVAIEVLTEREQILERRFDPEGRVAISTENEERSSQNNDSGGQVTVASNLPEGDVSGQENSQSQSNETRARVNYEVSETNRDILRAPGGIKRMTVAVLVNGVVSTAADGTQTNTPRSDAELADLRELVAAAAGLDEARGDSLTLRSMEFLPRAEVGTGPTSGIGEALSEAGASLWLQIGAAVAAIAALLIFVLRPMLRAAAPQAEALDVSGGATLALGGGAPEVAGDFALPDLPVIDFLQADDSLNEEPSERLQRLIRERQAESLEILRGWLEPEEVRR